MKSTLFSNLKTNNSTKDSPDSGENLTMEILKKTKSGQKNKLNHITVLIAIIMSNIVTALSLGLTLTPTQDLSQQSTKDIYPHHSEVLIQLTLKTPYKKNKEVVITNNQRSLYIDQVILTYTHEDSELLSEYTSKGLVKTFTALVPTNKIELLRGQNKLIALPKETPKFEIKPRQQKRKNIRYEVKYD